MIIPHNEQQIDDLMDNTEKNLHPNRKIFLNSPIPPTEFKLLDGLVWGIIFFLYTLAGLFQFYKGNPLASNGLLEPAEWFLYILMFSLFPIAAAIIGFKVHNNGERLPKSDTTFLWNNFFLFVFIGNLVCYPIVNYLYDGILRIPSLVIIKFSGVGIFEIQWAVCIHFIGFLYIFFSKKTYEPHSTPSFIFCLGKTLIILNTLGIVLFFLIYSPYNPTDYPINYLFDLLKNPEVSLYLKVGTGISFLVFLSVYVEKRIKNSRPYLEHNINKVAFVLLSIFIFSLFDIGLDADARHYSAFVGPAIHINGGGQLFIDVFSLYGVFPNLIMSWALDILPGTYSSAALLVRILDLIYYLVFACIIFRVCRFKCTACLLAVPALILVKVSAMNIDNIGKFPSATALRYLIPFILPLALSFLPKGKYFSIWTILPVIISSFWSVEVMGITIATYLFFLIAVGVYTKNVLQTFKNLFFLITSVLATHAIFIALFKYIKGIIPNYLGYFQSVQSTDITEPTSFISVPMPPYFWLWGTNAFIYFLIILYILHRALETKFTEWKDEDWKLVSTNLPIVAAGIFAMFYLVGRSLPGAWVLDALPFMAAVISGMDMIFSSRKISFSNNVLFKGLIYFTIAIISSLVIYRFATPYSPYTGNSTILRICFTPEGCSPKEIYKNLITRINTPLYLQPNHHPSKLLMGIIKDSYDMVNLFYPNSNRVLILNSHPTHGFPYPTTVLLYAGKRHRLPISNTIEDELSQVVRTQIFDSLNSLREGEILITLEGKLFNFEQEIVNKIKEKWNLCPIMRSQHGVIAYKLSSDKKCKLSQIKTLPEAKIS